jgi:hypothetical protein
MKIDLQSIDQENFTISTGIFCNVPAVLVIPHHIGTKFNQQNKIFRSSIWSLNGELLSASFKKFVNWGENPENFPTPNSLKNTTIVEKIDGSTVVIDYVNDVLSMRTRGTFSINTMENASDFEVCIGKYCKIKDWLQSHPNYSLICEITTPNLRIVIRYGDEPDFWLIGAINKDDYSLMTQTELDQLASELGLKRPEKYTFSTISDLLENVDKWIGKEGVCLYSSDNQEIWKIKATDYLIKHRLKDEFGNIEKIVDFFISEGCPDYAVFSERIASVTDWETFQEVRGDVSKIIDAWKNVNNIVDYMKIFVQPLKSLPRKDAALKILSSYGETNRSSFCFTILSGKELGPDQFKKLLWQSLKK